MFLKIAIRVPDNIKILDWKYFGDSIDFEGQNTVFEASEKNVFWPSL